MTINVKSGASVKAAHSIRMMIATATSKRVRRIRRVETGDVLQTIFAGFDAIVASISPNPLFVFSFNNSTVSGSVTTIITGGVAPFTYSWTVLSHSGTLPTITTPTAASPTFIQTGVALETSETAEFRVSITDAIGQTVTADLSAEFYNQSFS